MGQFVARRISDEGGRRRCSPCVAERTQDHRRQVATAYVWRCMILGYQREIYVLISLRRFTFLYCREVLMTIHTRLAKAISPWPKRPAFLEDAHLRRFTIPLNTINSWEV